MAALVVSCAGDKSASSPAVTSRANQGARIRSADSWADDMAGGGGYKQDSEGNWKAVGNRRSSFDRKDRDSPYFKGDFAGTKKEFKTGEYQKKSWWGNKSYELKEYTGNTDGSRFQKSSRFGGMAARDGTKAAREGGGEAYKTNDFATKDAREASGKTFDHPSDAETDVRRRVFTSPSVIDWQQQRGLSIGETKGILGKQ
ncbi:hypothetical protein KBB96_14895 [Luteolibacter ambystomatis]|uniref:Uncharacterized protein n=1 Tax=Luteolibacter ambystomatis TaxID=2824561 RepID=A0A975G7E9_9BACT|nr:hypothetical protein [Luteolibacter ambystomatis]QUE50151.1 hypothetical protein KBB96_14895 [Luteolibacter ambystomatis]